MFFRIYLLFTFLLFSTGCNVDYEAMAKQRVEYAKKNQGEIVIAAIQDSKNSNYIKGISLAIEEINLSENRLLGRPVRLYLEQGFSNFNAAKSLVRRITNNPKISLVLGHTKDDVVIPTSAIYEKSQLLFFPPLTTTGKLTIHHSLFTFRMLPDNIHLANQIADFCKIAKFKKIAILYNSSEKFRTLSLLFKKEIANKNINLAFTYSITGNMNDFRPLLASLKKTDFDAVLISTNAKTSSLLIKQMREMGINKPVLGTNDLNSQKFKASIAITENKIIAPTPYNISSKSPINQKFIKHYKIKYEQLPDANAALGYDSIMLFANKVERAKSTLPSLLASTIRYSPKWEGVTGVYHFSNNGNLEGKDYSFRILKNGAWYPVFTPYSDL